MARSAAVVVDWNAFRHHHRDHELELWTRFPLEIDGSNIVTPHMFAIRRRPGHAEDGSRACTIAEPALFAMFAYRTAAHREYLEHDVVPRLAPRSPQIALVDSFARTYELAGAGQGSRSIAGLPAELARWSGSDALADISFESRLDRYEQSFGRDAQQTDPETARRLESTPLRLWEVLFLRGHAYRYELIDGEVVEVGDLGTRTAANRTLMQCVRDAELVSGASPIEDRGWIRVGRFRFRQHDAMIELRVGLSPADIRVAFAPHELRGQADDLASLVGVLVAGGDNGKTELINGYTWASVRCNDDREMTRLAEKLASEIKRWTGAPVECIADNDASFPAHRDGRWVIKARGGRDPLVLVFVPMYRDDLLPWDAVS